ncbi:MAG: mobilization protein C [Candidatus Melainabacteria bacterium]|nr:mobilization protein C [Candidatus Melainabacteria bacterium]
MPRPIAEQVAELKARKEALEKRLATLEHRQKSLTRKQDTRRKILAGALALEHCQHNPNFGTELYRLLDDCLSKAADRELFTLPPLPEKQAKADKPPKSTGGEPDVPTG